MHKYYIGCSGYYYPGWKNKFYPAGTQPKNWLHYYSTVFNTVELNGTFYRTPKLADLKKYATVTPDYFRFSVKMSKYITHVLKLKNSKIEIEKFQSLIVEGLGNKLNCFLFQLPPSFHYTEENLKLIISNIPGDIKNIVEFRHISWWNKEVESALKNNGLTFCNIDYPGIHSYFIHTSSLFYLRLHGNPELFKSAYSEAELKELYKNFPTESKRYNIYFNNTYYEAGYTNALQLKELSNK